MPDDPKKPRVTAVKWKTPDSAASRKPFDGICPWCKTKAEPGAPGISSGRTCGICGAIAWGAAAADYDEIVDDALDTFAIEPTEDIYLLGSTAWAKAEIEVREGGCGGEHAPMGLVFWYWFRKTPTIN